MPENCTEKDFFTKKKEPPEVKLQHDSLLYSHQLLSQHRALCPLLWALSLHFHFWITTLAHLNLSVLSRNSFTFEKVALASEIVMSREVPVGIGSKETGTIRGQSIFFCYVQNKKKEKKRDVSRMHAEHL